MEFQHRMKQNYFAVKKRQIIVSVVANLSEESVNWWVHFRLWEYLTRWISLFVQRGEKFCGIGKGKERQKNWPSWLQESWIIEWNVWLRSSKPANRIRFVYIFRYVFITTSIEHKWLFNVCSQNRWFFEKKVKL